MFELVITEGRKILFDECLKTKRMETFKCISLTRMVYLLIVSLVYVLDVVVVLSERFSFTVYFEHFTKNLSSPKW